MKIDGAAPGRFDAWVKKDTRGTRTPSARTILCRESKAEKQRLATASANAAGYRRGRDEQDRLNTIRQDAEVNTRRAISRVGIPADFNLNTSRTWRIANLSVGILVLFHKAERRDRMEPE
jgi:hypothetical protein